MFTISKKTRDYFHWPWNKSRQKAATKRKYIILGVIASLFIARVALVNVLQKKTNEYLATFSPTYAFHIEDLDISILRMAYRFEGIEGTLKRNGRRFAFINTVDVSIAWRELFKGRVLTDITIKQLEFTYLSELTKAASKKDTTDAKEAKETLFPVSVEKVELVDSKIVLEEYPGLSANTRLTASGIEGRLINLTATEKFPYTFYNLKANLFGTSVLKTTGQLNLLKAPAQWDFNGEILGFKLTEANGFLKRNLPLTFTKGTLDIYAEAISQNGEIKGYIKPFFHKIDLVSSKETWDIPKQPLIEILAALGNIILRSSRTETLATQIPFTYKKEFKVDSSEAIEKAIENGFKQELTPGLENKYELH